MDRASAWHKQCSKSGEPARGSNTINATTGHYMNAVSPIHIPWSWYHPSITYTDARHVGVLGLRLLGFRALGDRFLDCITA